MKFTAQKDFYLQYSSMGAVIFNNFQPFDRMKDGYARFGKSRLCRPRSRSRTPLGLSAGVGKVRKLDEFIQKLVLFIREMV